MRFLGPIAGSMWAYVALGAAVLAVGAYIIKMRRRRFEVPFVQLWKRVLEQKDANALWKQLKRLISLLLMLLILGLILFAALDPTLGVADRKARSVVILVDSSGSMKTLDGDPAGTKSRMEIAKQKADDLIDSMGGGDVAIIMKVDGQSTPMTRFTNDKAMLHKALHGVGRSTQSKEQNLTLDGITASDTPADLSRALGAAADALRDRKNPLIVLISDGAFPEAQLGLVTWEKKPAGSGSAANPAAEKNLASVDLSGIDVRYIPVGRRSDNVGIVAFNVRRYIANKAAYEVFIEVQNFGTEPAKRVLTLQNGDTPVDTRDITLAPGQRMRQIYEKLPASEDYKLRAQLKPAIGPDKQIVKGGSDAFALDDIAYALLPARKKQKVLMVTADNLFLEAALLVYDNADPLKVTPDEYNAKPQIADGMDVVIFDDFTPEVVPSPPTSLLYFHPTGASSPFKVAGELPNPRITEIDEDHPTMRWITMSDVYTDKSNTFAVDSRKGESTIAYSVRDSIIAAKRENRRKILAVGFSLPAAGRDSATDMPLKVAFPVLIVNALDWFAGDTADLLTTYATGRRERIPLDGVVGATEAVVKGPDGRETRTPVIDGLATFYGSQVGYYDVAAKDASGHTMAQIALAANLASVDESDIAPSVELTLGGKKLQAPEAFEITRSQKLWWYFVLLAMALIVTEWITYHRRITV
ncbi:MAG TPA: VWA domain-containing protein [Kofleriaceae bacterium]|nr:VWA domain-containing protein [Kofleriaceae bacterium]